MKNSVKKIFLVLCAASVMLISSTAFATPTSEPAARTTKTISASDTSAATSTAGDDEAEDTSDTEADTENTTTAGAAASGAVVQSSANPVPTAISTGQNQTGVVQNTEAQRVAEKKYASKGSLAVWIILTILINAILSFAIANRFYKLAKKDTHVSAELRALRRDLEEKFVSNVGGFTEMETDVSNTNDNYSMNGSIKMPERKSTDFAAESEDVFKRWESRMSQRSGARAAVPEEMDAEPEEDFEEEERRPVRKFRPTRASVPEADDAEDESYDDEQPEERSVAKSVKNKAKNILGDIFPFKED